MAKKPIREEVGETQSKGGMNAGKMEVVQKLPPRRTVNKDLEEKHEWFRSSDEVKRGYIKGATFGLKQVYFSVVDGLAIFEGDICLGKADEVARQTPLIDADRMSARGIARGIGITGEEFRWPNGIIPFEIDAGVPNQTATNITNAIAHWKQNTNIRFVQRTPANSNQFPNFVRFIAGNGCSSPVGMRGDGMQKISLGAGCGFGPAVHEIGHAVGLWHEQSREDRDVQIRIHWQNIIQGREHNFNQHIADGDDIGIYDFDSIMHYGPFAFSSNGQATIVTLGGQQIGQRNGLSAGDIAAVHALYPQLEHLVNRSAEFGTPPAAGPPTACVIPGLGVHNIAYRDTSGRLHELWRDANGATGTTNLTDNAGAPTAAGNPFAYVDTARNTVILLYRDDDGTVRSLYWSTGAVGKDNLSGTAGAPRAAGDPVGYYTPAADTHHVIYRTGDGHLHELNWIGVAPVVYGGNLTEAISAPTAAGDPTAFSNAAGANIVVYRSDDGRILSLYWTEGPSGLDDLSGVAGTPLASGDPVAYYTAHDDTHQVVYRGPDGHLYELYWPNVAPVVGWDLTAESGAPAAAGNPTAYYSAGTNTKHVIYRSADGRLHDIKWMPGGGTPVHVDLTAFAEAPPAADRPAAFTVEGPNTQHVAYRGTDKHIYEVLEPATINTVIDLNGRWTDGSTRSAVISAAFKSLTIDMSAYNRPAAHGFILDDSTITVTFPDDKTYTGKLQSPNIIRWSNGSAWRKV